MPSKFQMYRQMAEEAARQVTGSYNGWISFLTTAARLYKYPYNEQLMIHAQRPDATACADYDFWLDNMGRYVRRHSKGIAVIDTRDGEPKLKYVFDVSDTGSMPRTRPVWLWQLTEENADRVSAMLEQNYDVSGEHGIREQLESVATRLVSEYWNDNSRDVFDIIDDSFLEEYDEYNIEVAFRNAAVVSSTYALMSRCGLDPDEYFTHEDFLNVFDFNTPAAATVLGTAVSQINGQILRQIEACIRSFEREQRRPAQAAERMEQNDRADLHEERRLPDPGHHAERDTGGSEAVRQVRASEEGISERTPPDSLEQHDSDRDAVSASEGDRRGGTPEIGADDARADETERRDGGTESQRPDEVGGLDEQSESAGRRNDSDRADLQLSPFGATTGRGEQLSLFPTEDEQIAYISQAEDVNYTPFAFSMSVPQEDLDHILRLDGNTQNARMEIVTEFSKGKSNEEIAAFLQKTFHGGNGIVIDDRRYSVWYGEDGIHIASGDAARYLNSAKIVSYSEAAERIGQLLEQGEYATNVELAEATGHERMELAQSLWYLKHDLSDEAREAGFLSTMDTMRGGGFPNETQRLAKALADPIQSSNIVSEYNAFLSAHDENRSLLRFHYHKPDELMAGLTELSLPRKEYVTDMAEIPFVKRFITEDEISACLSGGSSMEGGKGRIYAYFTAKHSSKEQVDFLKNEYGLGGHAPAVSGEWHSSEDHSGKGISLKKGGCAEVQLNWANVAKRVSELIRKGRYLTPEEKTQYEQLQRRNAERNTGWNDYNAVKEAHPDDVVLYQVGDFFEFYGEDARTAGELLNIRLTSRNIPDVGRVDMCGIPAYSLEQYVEKLRDRYDVTISAVDADTHERSNYTLRSVDHEAERAIDAHEAEFGADGTRAFGGTAPEEIPQELTISDVQAQLDKYIPIIRDRVVLDEGYRNACTNSDRENALIEGNAAIRKTVMMQALSDMELYRLYNDVPEFRDKLHSSVLEATYDSLAGRPRDVSPVDIDDALRRWNGDIRSKHAVVRYMKDHARERDTAAWLAREYGSDVYTPQHFTVAGSDTETVLSWAKIQRRIAQLIQADNFYTEQERDNLDDVDPIAIREALGAPDNRADEMLAQAEAIAVENEVPSYIRFELDMYSAPGEDDKFAVRDNNTGLLFEDDDHIIHAYDTQEEALEYLADVERRVSEKEAAEWLYVEQAKVPKQEASAPDRFSIRLLPYEGGITGIWDAEIQKYYGENGQLFRFAEQANAIDYLTDMQRRAGIPEKVIFTTPNGNAYHPGDSMLAAFGENSSIQITIDRVDEDDVWYTMPSVPEQEAVSMERTEFEKYVDTGNITVLSAERSVPETVSIDPSDRFHVVSFDRGARTLYTVWDDETQGYYVDAEGVTEDFTSEWQAEAYRLELQGQAEQALMERAKGFINDFCQREYGEDADFSDLTKIGVAYSVTPDDEIPIQADIDLENFRLVRSLGEEHLETRQYSSLHDLIANELEGFDFGDLTYVSDEEVEQYQNRWHEPTNDLAQEVADFDAERMAYREQVMTSLTPEQRRTVEAMEIGGFPFRPTERDPIYFGDVSDYPTVFTSWEDAYNFINEAELKLTPGLRDKVQAVLHPEPPFPYAVGDTVYLEDNKPFIIESIGRFDISLRDPTLFYPIFRAESRESFARLMERFPQPQKEPVESVSYHTETVAVYPAEENHLPYDVVIETLHIDEPTPPTLDDTIDGNPISVQINGEWQTFPNKEAAETAMFEEYKDKIRRSAENFHITDDDLGVGGAKAKFRENMNAINLLKQLEFDGMQATPEQQEVLSRYVGWGGLADAFDETKDNWKDEFAELYAALTPEEYAAARASTLNAHYTSPTVIRAIYDAVENMGFQTGNILEPSMGVGNFFGMLPDSMASSKLYGVELDSLTGRIAKQLYPKADITVAGFETTDRKDFFDLAIGNVPFGQYQVSDRAYDKLGFSIHNYFFAKALDQVRPGGVVAFVTSRYTMDAKDSKARKYLAQRADFLGAIRLPNNAFRANAGTDVVSDIIFLQKRDRPIDIEPDWVHLGENADGFAINSYFVDNPDMILGRQTSESTQYGKQDFTVEPYDDLDLGTQLNYAIQSIKGTYTEAELPDLGEDEKLVESIPADPNVKNFSYTIVDGEVYYRQNSIMTKPALNATAKERVKGMVELRDCVQKLIGQQMDGFISDETIRQTQAELNTLYDNFTAKYGLINSRGNALAFADDNSYYLLCSLEELDEDRNLKRKADMFTKRTIKAHEVVTSVDTASEALALSISEKACVDMPYMSQLTGKDEDTLASELRGVIFRNPENKRWETADEYLSGNVREKLRIVQSAHTLYEGNYADNVEALKAAQPKDLDASEIEVRLGATWIDPDYIREFMWEVFETPFYQRRTIDVNYSTFTAEWNIKNKSAVSYSDITANMTYGTERTNAYKILEDTLNLRDVRIYDTKYDADGKERRVLNSKETTLAQQKQQAIKDAFRDWIWKDSDRRHELVTKYNELFNSTRPREYDGSHITFTGMNPEISLREHQLNAVAHVLYGGNTLLAHEVGAGKSATRS